jgi:hypothetical protein
MKDSTTYAILVTLGNLALLAILIGIGDRMPMGTGLTLILGVPAVVLLAELVLGIVFAVSDKHSRIGAGILIGLGITLLIGLSVCGIMMRM